MKTFFLIATVLTWGQDGIDVKVIQKPMDSYEECMVALVQKQKETAIVAGACTSENSIDVRVQGIPVTNK